MNNCLFSGRLTKDSDFRVTDNGQTILNNTIAVNVGYGVNKDTMFLDFSLFGKPAEYVANYGQKGNRIMLQGEIRIDKYQKKDGTEGKAIRLRATNAELVDMKPKDGDVLPGRQIPSDDDFPF